MRNEIPLSIHEKKISREVDELLRGILEPLKVWMPIFELPVSRQNESLKDIAFVVLIQCLKETLKQYSKRFKQMAIDAEKSGRASIAGSFPAFRDISRMPAAVFVDLKISEQVLLSLTRDRILHGYLDARVRETGRGIDIVNGELVERMEFSPAKIQLILGLADKISSRELAPIRAKVLPAIQNYCQKAVIFEEIYEQHKTIEDFFLSGSVLFNLDAK